jgi:phosphatidylethanolamine/phosphatidyl-N-methylethanolamine N-methyltransferase
MPIRFIQESIRDFYHTGAIVPSGPALCDNLTKKIETAISPVRVLEAGYGTGAVTKSILKKIPEGSAYLGYDISEIFYNKTSIIIAKHERVMSGNISARLVLGDILNAPVKPPYDYIVCSLPFFCFEKEVVQKIMDHLMHSLKPGGWLSYFEYIGTKHLKKAFVGKTERLRLKEVGEINKDFKKRYNAEVKNVLLNIPPASCNLVQKPDIHTISKTKRLSQAIKSKNR